MTMTKGMVAMAVAIFVSGGQALADHDTQRVCFRLMPYSDYLDLTVNAPVRGHQAVNGNWIVPTTASGGFAGSLERDVPAGAGKRYSLTGTLYFSGGLTQLIGITAKVNGEWKIVYTSQGATTISGISGTPFQKVSCSNPLGTAAAQTDGPSATRP